MSLLTISQYNGNSHIYTLSLYDKNGKFANISFNNDQIFTEFVPLKDDHLNLRDLSDISDTGLVAISDTKDLMTWDPLTNELRIGRIAGDNYIRFVRFTPDMNHLFLFDDNENDCILIDAKTFTEIKRISLNIFLDDLNLIDIFPARKNFMMWRFNDSNDADVDIFYNLDTDEYMSGRDYYRRYPDEDMKYHERILRSSDIRDTMKIYTFLSENYPNISKNFVESALIINRDEFFLLAYKKDLGDLFRKINSIIKIISEVRILTLTGRTAYPKTFNVLTLDNIIDKMLVSQGIASTPQLRNFILRYTSGEIPAANAKKDLIDMIKKYI